jgi:hypothetical protein
MGLSPIVVFVYNRLWHTQKTIESLLNNKQSNDSDIIIFSDAPKTLEQSENVEKVRKYINSIKEGFKKITIIERSTNFGLAQSIITGVTEIVNKYGKIIVLEDDMIVSKYFLKFMNDGLNLYEKDDRVVSIHGYLYPIKKEFPETFFLKGADCWGWATWERGWGIFEKDGSKLLKQLQERKLENRFDFNGTFPYINMLKGQIAGEINSWAVRWYASAFLQDKLTLYPGKSLLNNIGNDGSGSNCPQQSQFDVDIWEKPIKIGSIKIKENLSAYNEYKKYFRKNFDFYRPFYRKILSKIKYIFIKN